MSGRPKFLIIDGHSLLFRAFYALPPLRTSQGVMTNAVHGFMRMLLRLISEEQPTHIVVAWDSGGPTFRHEAFADYKATRRAMPDDLISQEPIVQEVLEAMHIAQLELPRYEADDLIGTLAHRAEQQDWDVLIVTGDHDALQLASARTTVNVTERGISQTTRYTPEVVEQRLGIAPRQVPDYKGLRGDTSDNIPGVPGIGEKTARQLVQKFGSMEQLLERVDEVTPPRVRDLLTTHAQQARDSKALATIALEAPLAADLQSFVAVAPDRARVSAALASHEMNSLAQQFRPAVQPSLPAGEAGPEPVALRADFEATVEAALRLLANTTSPVALALEAERSLIRVESNPPLVKRVAAAVDDSAFCVDDWQALTSWLEDEWRPKILHDAKTALRALRARGLRLQGIVGDTALMAHLLDPTKSHRLQELSRRLLGRSLSEPAPPPAGQLDFEDASRSLPPRLVERARATYDVYQQLLREVDEAGQGDLLREVELPLTRVLVDMEDAGMLVDVDHLRSLQRRLDAELRALETSIYELAGTAFNINSPKQLQVVLFEKLNLPKGRKTKTGYSTDAGVLEKLAAQHQVVRQILDYRELSKLNSTFVAELIARADAQTHRVHSTFNQTGAATGRLASYDPNLMNIPIRTKWGKEIRRAFVAPPGHWIVSADYSQIELRILAHLSGDETLRRAFARDLDIHTQTAADLFGVGVDEVTSEMRRQAKVVNFGIAYGISGFGLSQQLGIEARAGLRLIETYFNTFPSVREWIDQTLETARQTGFVTTILGRRRPVPDLNSPVVRVREAAERVAMNTPVQGSAADIIKVAMVRVAEELRTSSLQARLLLQVHDELVFEAPQGELEALAKKTRQAMGNAVELTVPLTVAVEFGANWLDLKEIG